MKLLRFEAISDAISAKKTADIESGRLLFGKDSGGQDLQNARSKANGIRMNGLKLWRLSKDREEYRKQCLLGVVEV